MFAAVGLFVILLIAILIIAYVQFRNPPPRTGPERPRPAAMISPTDPIYGAPAASLQAPTLPPTIVSA